MVKGGFYTLLFAMAMSSGVWAASVSLNGVGIDGATNHRFEDCTVIIDQYGNVNIIANGYVAQKGGEELGSSEVEEIDELVIGSKPSQRFWIVTDNPTPGMLHYEVEAFINDERVRTFFSIEENLVFEVTDFLKIGPNRVKFIARKKVNSHGGKVSSPEHIFRMVLGEGYLSGRNVVITKKLVQYQRDGGESQDVIESDEVFIAR